MTPKEKAVELVDKMYATQGPEDGITYYEAIDCALIAVDEIIKVCPYYSKKGAETIEQLRANDYEFITYWEEVKQEIEKL